MLQPPLIVMLTCCRLLRHATAAFATRQSMLLMTCLFLLARLSAGLRKLLMTIHRRERPPVFSVAKRILAPAAVLLLAAALRLALFLALFLVLCLVAHSRLALLAAVLVAASPLVRRPVFRLCLVALVLLALPVAPFFFARVLRGSSHLGWPMPNGISLVLVVLVRLRRLPSPPGLRLVALVGTVLGTPMPLEPPCFLRRCLARGSLRPTSAVC